MTRLLIQQLKQAFICSAVLYSSCTVDKHSGEKILVVNNSDQSIMIYDSRSYPDTSMRELFSSGCGIIAPGTSCTAQTKYGWRSELDQNRYGVILFFIVGTDTAQNIFKRYAFTKDSLERRNWTITYP